MTDGPTSSDDQPLVGIIMGSSLDLKYPQPAIDLLVELGVPHEARVVSAHRTPDWMFEYAEQAEARGLEVIIAAAGGAAHLPGMVAAKTLLPVLGVPIPATMLNGMDSLLSIVQMPKGVPVGTLAIGEAGAANAALLATAIVSTRRPELRERLARVAAPANRRRSRQHHDHAPALMSIIAPGATIGILGGGQLGRMTAMAARTLGYKVHVLDPDAELRSESSRRSRCHRQIRRCRRRRRSRAALRRRHARDRAHWRRSAHGRRRDMRRSDRTRAILEVMQDRSVQKRWLAHRMAFRSARTATSRAPKSSRAAARELGPLFVKASRGGYDGRSQARVANARRGRCSAWTSLGERQSVAEQALDLQAELSVMVARRPSGEVRVYPPLSIITSDRFSHGR